MTDLDAIKDNWVAALADVRLKHPNPSVDVQLVFLKHGNAIRVLYSFTGLQDSRSDTIFPTFEYYFYANHWPGDDKARLWVLAVWALFMEHEGLEHTLLNGEQLADPHTSDWCAGHRVVLDRRHDMTFMLERLTGGNHD